MSHFTVLVIGENAEEQLAPYHEFECTGNDEFIQNIDKLEEHKTEYETKTKRMIRYIGSDENVLAAESSTRLREANDPFFYRDPKPTENVGGGFGWGNGIRWDSRDWEDGLGYRVKVFEVPEDWEEVDVPFKDTMTFLQFVTEWNSLSDRVISTFQEPDLSDANKYGWVRVNENGEVLEIIRRTNPNAKWDWYVLGGRWSGFFKLKPEHGIVGLGRGPGASELIGDHADRCLVREIDFKGMRDDAAEEAQKNFDEYYDIIQNFPDTMSWDAAREKYGTDNIEDARNFYNSQPGILALRERKFGNWGCALDRFGKDRDTYIQRQRNTALSTFAVLKDGKWHERGKMGWWACVTDEMDQDKWNEELNRLYDDLPPDTVVSIYDCHI